MATLADEYRPTTFEDVAGQDRAVSSIRRVLERGWGARGWWITGSSGTGKTTLAKIIGGIGAAELATEEYTAGQLTPAAIKELEAHYRLKPLPIDGKQGYCIVVNESHGLARHTVRALLDTLERIPKHVCWIFTTTNKGQKSLFEDDADGDCAPLVSRCQVIGLVDDAQSRLALAKRAKAVAMAAGCDGLPEEMYLYALNSCQGNLRALLQRVDSGQMADEARAFAVEYLSKPLAQQDAQVRATMQGVLA